MPTPANPSIRAALGLADLLIVWLAGCSRVEGTPPASAASGSSSDSPAAGRLATATFAGGCFWCMEPPFEKLAGVVEVVSGYSGGAEPSPTYEAVSSGRTGHAEAVQVRYDPARVGYAELLEVFWRQIDPTDPDGQFVDRGRQYRSAIFYHDDEQRELAEASRSALARSGRFTKPIVTEIVRFTGFHPAEDYHQDYYERRALRYKFYRSRSGRDQYLERVWGSAGPVGASDQEPASAQEPEREPAMGRSGQESKRYAKPSDAELRRRLSPLQYEVTQREGTERPFENEYWDHEAEGIYVDVVSGEPLFGSRDKFESGTGWPSFTRPLEPGNLVEREDRKLLMKRTEVRSRHGESHLGHVFPDGPAPTGLRYCINSAALRFVPKQDLEKEGYGEYRAHFED